MAKPRPPRRGADRKRHRPPDPDELPEELLDHVVGGVAPEAALARFEYFRRIATERDTTRGR
jgi:hypothetical protein